MFKKIAIAALLATVTLTQNGVIIHLELEFSWWISKC
jgi:hypothetical protein